MTLRSPLIKGALVGLATVAVVWVALLGMAKVRYFHDRTFCRNWETSASGKAVAHGYDRYCIKGRESMRWGPYHAFGGNGHAGD